MKKPERNPELPYRATSAIEDIYDLVTDYKAQISALTQKADAAVSAEPIKNLLAYKWHSADFKNVRYPNTYNSYSGNYEFKEPMSLELVKVAFEDDKKTHEENQKIVQHNTKVFNFLAALFEKYGLKKTRSELKSSRSRKRVEVTCGWYSELQVAVVRGDGWYNVENGYNGYFKALADHLKLQEETQAKKVRQLEVEKKAREADLVIGAIAGKYGVPIDKVGDVDDCINLLLAKNKYLKLAHYLAKNRGDWSDGHSYADIGLDSFFIETPLDKEIVDEIVTLISNWDGDGRCFRDCTHNYDSLFELAKANNSELYDDYNKLSEYVCLN